jgi:hypothetical protein
MCKFGRWARVGTKPRRTKLKGSLEEAQGVASEEKDRMELSSSASCSY